MITKVLKNSFATALAGTSFVSPTHVAWGSGTTSATEDDTTLGTETLRKTISDIVVNGATTEFTSTIATTELIGSTITEIGLLNASSVGSLSLRDVFGSIEKTNSFNVDSIIQITIL